MNSRVFRVMCSGQYWTFENYVQAMDRVALEEKRGSKCSVVELVTSGRRKGSEWTVYETPILAEVLR